MDFFETIKNLDDVLETFLLHVGVCAPLFSCLLIFLEATFAFLPLCVFIVINVITLGPVLGCILSWIFTVLGSFFAFILWRKGLSKWFDCFIAKRVRVQKFMKQVAKLSFIQLTLILALPFTPSFFVNLGAGISKIESDKYLNALLMGKCFVVLFWAYVGNTFLNAFDDPWAIVQIVVFVLVVYIIWQFINKKFDLEGKL